MVKRSRDQSQEAPIRLIWRLMVEPDSSFHCHTRLHEYFASEVAAVDVLLIQLSLDHDLGSDSGMIRARLP